MGFATTAAIAGTIFSGVQAIKGLKDQKELREEINKARETEPINPFEEARVERGKFDSAKEVIASGGATAIDAASRDTRSLIPVAESVSQGQVKANENILNLIAQEEARVSELFGRGESERQRLIQRNEEVNIFGLGQALQTSRQDTMSAIGSTLTGILSTGSALNFEKNGGIGGLGGVGGSGQDPLNTGETAIGKIVEQPGAVVRSGNVSPIDLNPIGRMNNGELVDDSLLSMTDIADQLFNVSRDIFEELGVEK